MKQILLMIAVVALVGCGKKEPVQPTMPNPEATQPTTPNPEAAKPEKERGKEATQPITPKGINQTSKVAIGTPIWEFKTGDEVRSNPAIGSDGTVYVGSDDGKLYAINGKS
ncbi:MAG: PQQ-binding-like beta-propeller repeat protein, partial [Verrucomicrobiota bacterium]|nr:PQQ-binding-like beta-propeller repeat protein [Verrucomicrobiota bacterium]